MKHCKIKAVAMGILLASAIQSPLASAQTFTEALTGGKASGVFRLRHESVDQDNALKDASALTLRSVLQYTTGSYNGFSAVGQFEDVRVVAGVADYSVPPSGFKAGQYSVIADPKSTEVNQGFLQYKHDMFTLKAGRQVISYDNQRFLGAVGWRQDWQVFDAVSAEINPSDKLKINYNFIDQRNRIFADDANIDSSDHLFHASYASPIGSLVAYGYLLEVDKIGSNSHDTFGIRLTGSKKIGGLDATYLAEFATQESETSVSSFDADYFVIEGGLKLDVVTAKVGYESLGSDNGMYGFSTPLATAHAFNGWADSFLGTPAQGLTDFYLNLSSKVFGGTLTAVLHDYEADESTPLIDDLGNEINLQFVKPISSNYTVGIKYANYSDGDLVAKVDTQKLWVWFQASF